MKCPRCQQDHLHLASFCAECGARLALACGSCGEGLPEGARFCPRCGQATTTGTAAEVRSPAPDTYTPKYLAEKILSSRAALEGERKQVTVLFADLKGSMELLAERDPEEARSLLDPVLERMMEAVHRYDGTVNQVMGDGVMALFGAPVAHGDHAVRACYAALRMQELVKAHAAQAFRAHGIMVRIRVGLNSGDVLVRSIRSDLRMDYTAVGQITHLAARMEQLAPPGAIWITADTLRLAESFVRVQPLGSVPVRGLDAPVEVYELVAPGQARTRFQAAALRGLTSFVGRDAELEQLRSAWEAARRGHGKVVAVEGEPGVGKSRLFHELTHSHRVLGCRILQASALPYGGAVSYGPVIDLLKAHFGIDERDDVRSIRAKATGHLLTLDERLKDALSPVLWLLDALPEPDPLWELEPPQRRQLTLDAVTRLLVCESQLQPLVLIIEDLHWIDTETQALLDALVENVPTTSILLLVNYRPEYGHRWSGKGHCHQLRIDPLPPETAEQLLQELIGKGPALAPLKRLLVGQTDGNPFFLEESVRTLVESGVLAGERGAYRVVKEAEAIRVPTTVQALLAGRIDRLPPGAKRLLQAASVIGKDVPVVLLQAIADEDTDVHQELAHLQAAEFLHEARLFPELEYTFKHALTHEVTYASLVHDRRLTLHRSLLATLERRLADQPTEEFERLARHAVGSEAWDKAARYLRQAAQRAIGRSSYAAAAGLLREALQVLARLPETPETLAQAIDARLELRLALAPLGQYQDILAVMREAEDLATRLGDRPRLGRVLADICARLRNVAGQHQQAIEVGRRALAIAAETGDGKLELEAQYRTGQAYFAIGDYRCALDLLSRCTEAAREDRQVSPLFASWSHAWLALTLSSVGRFIEARSQAQEGLRIAEGAEHPFTVAEALTAVGSVLLARGDIDPAIEALGRARVLIRTWNLQSWAALARLGYAYVLCGRSIEARELLEEVTRHSTTMSSLGVGRAMQLAWLGEACLLGGQRDDAREHAHQAMSLAQRHQERSHEAWILRLLGTIASRGEAPDVERAEGYYREALAVADELGMRPLVAHCHADLGQLFRKTSRQDQARPHLIAATTMYREMDMTVWTDRAEAEMRELS
jgi:class 3 adenylate cyclase/tetratricopeptide (TPR) repeat protein